MWCQNALSNSFQSLNKIYLGRLQNNKSKRIYEKSEKKSTLNRKKNCNIDWKYISSGCWSFVISGNTYTIEGKIKSVYKGIETVAIPSLLNCGYFWNRIKTRKGNFLSWTRIWKRTNVLSDFFFFQKILLEFCHDNTWHFKAAFIKIKSCFWTKHA